MTSWSRVIAAHAPDAVAVETPFAGQNVKSLDPARACARRHPARGAERAAVEIFEYSPRSVKSAVVGYGGAEKEQVAKMVRHAAARLRDADDVAPTPPTRSPSPSATPTQPARATESALKFRLTDAHERVAAARSRRSSRKRAPRAAARRRSRARSARCVTATSASSGSARSPRPPARGCRRVAQSWVVYSMTNSAFLLGVDGFLATGPMLLFSLFGGVIADRVDAPQDHARLAVPADDFRVRAGGC